MNFKKLTLKMIATAIQIFLVMVAEEGTKAVINMTLSLSRGPFCGLLYRGILRV